MSELSSHDDLILSFQELANGDGPPPRKISLREFDIKPLGFDDLVAATPQKCIKTQLEVLNG